MFGNGLVHCHTEHRLELTMSNISLFSEVEVNVHIMTNLSVQCVDVCGCVCACVCECVREYGCVFEF